MSVSDNYIPVRTLGNGVTTEFTGTWDMIAAGNERVYLETVADGTLTLQTLTTDYTLEFDEDGFTVTFLSAPSSSYYVVIARDVTQSQATPFKTSQGYQGSVLENALDKITAICQDIQDEVDRCPKTALGVVYSNLTLDAPVDGEILTWNGTDGNVTSKSVAELALSSLDNDDLDITFTGLASGDFLKYNGSAWVNRTGAQVLSDIGAQASDATLTALASALTAANKIPYATDVDTLGELDFKDEDDMTSNSATALASQQSIKAYVDAQSVGALVLLGTVSASDDTTIEFINGTGGVVFNSTYEEYELHIIDLVPETDATDVYVRTSSNTGVSFDAGASDYAWTHKGGIGSASDADSGDAADTEIQLTDSRQAGSDTGEGFNAVIKIFNPAGTLYTVLGANVYYTCSASAVPVVIDAIGVRLSAADVDAIQVLMSADNIASGEFKLYGVVKS